MALETATHLPDLVTTNPVAGDNVSVGDDHIRLLKSTIQNSIFGQTGMALVVGSGVMAANNVPVTLSVAPASYAKLTNALILLTITGSNTGAVTCNFNALGSKSIKTAQSVALASGQITGGAYLLTYNGTDFLVLSKLAA